MKKLPLTDEDNLTLNKQIAALLLYADRPEEVRDFLSSDIEKRVGYFQNWVAHEVQEWFVHNLPGRSEAEIAAGVSQITPHPPVPKEHGDARILVAALNKMQAMGEVMDFAARTLGDEAHPAVNAYLAGLRKMTDEDYNSLSAHLRLLQDVSPYIPNPYRGSGARPEAGLAASTDEAAVPPITAPEILDKIGVMEGAGADKAVSRLFALRVAVLPPKEQRRIADQLEDDFIAGISFPRRDESELRAAAETYSTETAHGLAAYLSQIARIKGDDAHPALKAYMRGLSDMSDADYNSPYAHLKLLNGLSPLKPNPFRNVPRP